MLRKPLVRLLALAPLAAFALAAACSGSDSTTSPAPTTTAPPTLVPSPTAVPSVTATPSATPTSTAATPSPTAYPTVVVDPANPCTFLGPGDLVFLGGPDGQPRPATSDFGPECEYPTAAGLVTVTLFPAGHEAQFEFAEKKLPIQDLGDEAFFDPDWSRVRVRRDDFRFQVTCFCILNSGTTQQTLEQIARAVVSNAG